MRQRGPKRLAARKQKAVQCNGSCEAVAIAQAKESAERRIRRPSVFARALFARRVPFYHSWHNFPHLGGLGGTFGAPEPIISRSHSFAQTANFLCASKSPLWREVKQALSARLVEANCIFPVAAIANFGNQLSPATTVLRLLRFDSDRRANGCSRRERWRQRKDRVRVCTTSSRQKGDTIR